MRNRIASAEFSPLTRRESMLLASAGVASFSFSGWLPSLAAQAADAARRSAKKCILLWMDGGPSQVDTFDPKPNNPFEPISTSVAGLQISSAFPNLAKCLHWGAIIRGMSTQEEADHGRARHYMHTGFRENAGGLTHPSLGAIVGSQRPEMSAGVPNFVVTGKTMQNFPFEAGTGYMSPRHRPLVIRDVLSARGIPHAAPAADDFDQRLELAKNFAEQFQRTQSAPAIETQQLAFRNAVELMRQGKSQLFDLSREDDKVRDRYGRHEFGQGCLLARRLVEAGVPFVEVYQGDWDTHEKRRTDLVRNELMPQFDQAVPALLSELNDRNLLDETLVICMGEFGRSPKAGKDGERNHYVKAWSTVLFGGGVKAGQAVGRTDDVGGTVEDRPVNGPQFMATILAVLGIDPSSRLMAPGERPVEMVDEHAEVVKEVFDRRA